MSKLWNKRTNSLTPYVAGEQPRNGEKVIKLNTNENPYPPSPEIKKFLQSYDLSNLRKYPDTTAEELREVISSFYQVPKDWVFCGNGSDEVLAFAFQAFFEAGQDAEPITFCDITYSFYPVYAQLYDIPTRLIPLKKDYCVEVSAFLEKSGGVVLANPNAPTGIALPAADIIRIVESDPERLVLVDEAYAAFSDESVIPYLSRYPNLLVTGTVSKAHALAGIRVGFAIGNPELIEGLCRVRDSFNSYPVDSLAIKIAAIAFRDKTWLNQNVEKIKKTRKRAANILEKTGFSVLPSQTNFIFASPPGNKEAHGNDTPEDKKETSKYPDAAALYQILKEKGILIRYFKQPRIDNYLRITIGSDEEMDAMLSVIKDIYGEN